MVVNLRNIRLCVLLAGLLTTGAAHAAPAHPSHSAPEIPADAQPHLQSKSSTQHFTLSAESQTLQIEETPLPYVFYKIHSADEGRLIIECEARESTLPLEVHLYDEQGKWLHTLTHDQFKAKEAFLLKPDRLQGSLSLEAYPNQALQLLFLPSLTELGESTSFEHPANQAARAMNTAAVVNEKRQVPHQKYGSFTLQLKLKHYAPAETNPAQQTHMPTGAAKGERAVKPEGDNVRDETLDLYRQRIEEARAAGNEKKVQDLIREASRLGITQKQLTD